MSFETPNPFLKENEPKGPFAIFFQVNNWKTDQWRENETGTWEEMLAWALSWLSNHDYKGRSVKIYNKSSKPDERIGFTVYPRDSRSVYVDPSVIFRERAWIVTFKPRQDIYRSDGVIICTMVKGISTVTRTKKPLDIRKLMET